MPKAFAQPQEDSQGMISSNICLPINNMANLWIFSVLGIPSAFSPIALEMLEITRTGQSILVPYWITSTNVKL